MKKNLNWWYSTTGMKVRMLYFVLLILLLGNRRGVVVPERAIVRF